MTSIKDLIIEKMKLNLIQSFKNNNIDDFIIEEIFNNYDFNYELNDNYNIIYPNIKLLFFIYENFDISLKNNNKNINILTDGKILNYFI